MVCDDLGMMKFALYNTPKAEIKIKDKADLLEAFLGALYVDKDLAYCQVFANVCFFPRLQQFILNQVRLKILFFVPVHVHSILFLCLGLE